MPRILNRSNSFASVFLCIKCEESQSVSPTGGEIAMEHGKVDALVQDQGHHGRTKEGKAHLSRAFKFYTDSQRKPFNSGAPSAHLSRAPSFTSPSLAPTPPLFPSPLPHHRLKLGSSFTSWLSYSLGAHPPSQCGMLAHITSPQVSPPPTSCSYPSASISPSSIAVASSSTP